MPVDKEARSMTARLDSPENEADRVSAGAHPPLPVRSREANPLRRPCDSPTLASPISASCG
jgi:hypothetical protein